ncbi:MAG: hypothetical protein J0L92_09920 [Deltaproteobacteria bacterium]|nr:hypothetical protein [Deltaproteobacteria bacterium]
MPFHGRRLRAPSAACALLLVGCGAPTVAGGRPALDHARSRLTLARELVSRRSVQLRLDDAGTATVVRPVRLLRASGVPDEYAIAFTPPRVCQRPSGTVSVEHIDTLDVDAPVAAELRDGEVVLRTRTAGVAEVHVRGVYVHGDAGCADGAPPGTRTALHATLRVEVNEDARPRLGGTERCGGDDVASFAATGTQVTLPLALLDEHGEDLRFDNISPLVPFEVSIESDVSVIAERNLLRFGGERGHVRFVAAGGADSWAWEWAVPPSEIVDATVRFYVPGSAGSPAEVTEGVRVQGSHRRLAGVFFQIRDAVLARGPLCDAADARWFHLESETPQVCRVVSVDSQACDGCSGPSFGHQAAALVRDGVCTVRVEAPQLDHGAGLIRRVSAEFVGIENFAEVTIAQAP